MESRQAVEVEVTKLADSDGAVRARAAKVLGRLGEAAAPYAATALAACLVDAEEAVRLQAARALGKLGRAAGPPATEGLARCLGDADEDVRAAAARALGWMGGAADEHCLEALTGALRDADAKVRTSAAGALGHLGEAAVTRAVESLAMSLHDEDKSVQVAAAGALVQHLSGVAGALVRRLEEGDVEVRTRTLRALGRWGVVAAPHAEAAVAQCFSDPDAGVRAEAQKAFALLKVSAAEPADGIAPLALPLARAKEAPTIPAPALHLAGAALGRKADRVVRHSEDVQVLPLGVSSEALDEERSEQTQKQKVPPELPWAAASAAQRRHGDDAVLPRLLGTPTPKTWEKPDFFMPPEEISESDSDEVRRDAVTA